MIFPVLLAKFLSAGAVAQAATGAGVVVIAFTGVGAAGALPGSVQDTFAAVVTTVTPLEPPTSDEPTAEPVEDVVPEESLPEAIPVPAPEDAEAGTTEGTEAAEVAEFDVAAWAVAGPAGYDSFGAWVSEGTHKAELKAALRAKGLTFGDVVSGWANGKGVDKEVLAALGVVVDDPADAPAEPETAVDAQDAAMTPQPEVAATEDSGKNKNKNKNKNNDNGAKRGNGNGHGKN